MLVCVVKPGRDSGNTKPRHVRMLSTAMRYEQDSEPYRANIAFFGATQRLIKQKSAEAIVAECSA